MKTKKCGSVRGLKDVGAREDGAAVRFVVSTHSKGDFEFDCDARGVLAIVHKLLMGLDFARERSGDKTPFVMPPMVVKGVQIRDAVPGPQVALVLLPTDYFGFAFAIPIDKASELASGLAKACAILAPERNPASLS
jgi:hypothetical protein